MRRASASLEQAGFYLIGGGRITLRVQPAPNRTPVDLTQRGEAHHRLCQALIAALPDDIVRRELDLIRRMMDWPEDCFQVRRLSDEQGPGNAVIIQIGDDRVTEVISAYGIRGVRAEAVAESALQQAKAFLADDVPVGRHLAEHLLVPIAVGGGGTFVTTQPNHDAMASLDLIRAFLGLGISTTEQGRDNWLVRIPGKT